MGFVHFHLRLRHFWHSDECAHRAGVPIVASIRRSLRRFRLGYGHYTIKEIQTVTTPLTTLTDSTFTSGRVGLYDSSSQTFDNFALAAVPEPSIWVDALGWVRQAGGSVGGQNEKRGSCAGAPHTNSQ